MWAVLFFLSCIIDSIDCSNFDENQGSEYEDFHDGSYSYFDDDDYENEYDDPSTELPRVRRYDRMTHTVPAPALTIGLPEVKDALESLMLGRNLSASDIRELEAGSQVPSMYPMGTVFVQATEEATVSTENTISATPKDEPLEIPVDFNEMKMSTKTIPERTKEQPTRSNLQRLKPPRTNFRDKQTKYDFIKYTDANAHQYTIYRSTNATKDELLEIPVDIYEMKMSTKTIPERTKEQPTRSNLQRLIPPRTHFREKQTKYAFIKYTDANVNHYTIDRSTNATIRKPTRSDFYDIQHEMIPFDYTNMDPLRSKLKFFENTPQESNTIDEPIINSVAEPTRPIQHALKELMLGRHLRTRYETPPVDVSHTTVITYGEYIDEPTTAQNEPTLSTYKELMLGRHLRTRYENPPVDVYHKTVNTDEEYIDEPTITKNKPTLSTYIGKRLNRQDYVNVRGTKPNFIKVPVRINTIMKTKDKAISERPNENKNIKEFTTRIGFNEQIEKIKNANSKLNKKIIVKPTRIQKVEKNTETVSVIGRPTKPTNTKPTRSEFFKVNVIKKPPEDVKQVINKHNFIEDNTEMEYRIQESPKTIIIMKPTRVEYTGQSNEIKHNMELEKPTRIQISVEKSKGFQSTSIKQPNESGSNQNINTDKENDVEIIEQNPIDLALDITSDDLFYEPLYDFVTNKPLRTKSILEQTSDSPLENKKISVKPTRIQKVEKNTETVSVIGRPTKPTNTKPTRSEFFKVNVIKKPPEDVKQVINKHNFIEDNTEMEYRIQESPKTTIIMKPTRVEYTGQSNEIKHNMELEKPTRIQISVENSKGFQSTSIKQPNESGPNQNINTDKENDVEIIEQNPIDLALDITSDDLFYEPLFDFVTNKPLRTKPILEQTSDSPLENASVTNENKFNKYAKQQMEEVYIIEAPTSINPSVVDLISKPLRVEYQKTSTSKILFEKKSKTYTFCKEFSVTGDQEQKVYYYEESKSGKGVHTDKIEFNVTGDQEQKVYYYEESNIGTEVYTDTETNMMRTPPVTRSKAKIFQTVFSYENDRPEDDVILKIVDPKEYDDDNDGLVAGNWSDEYDPLEFLLTDSMRTPGPFVLRATYKISTTSQILDTSIFCPLVDEVNRNHYSTNTTVGSNLTTTTTAGSNLTTTTTVMPTTTTKRKKPKKNRTTTTTTTAYPFDVDKFLDLVANLTYDYYTNLTAELNETLIRLGAPTCPTPSTSTTTTTATPPPLRPDYASMENKIMGKCYVCGLEDEGIPWNAYCSDAFAGDFIPLAPVDARSKGYLAKFRKYCRYDDVDHYVANETMPRTIFGRWTGGCGVRWTDISSIYTQRTCRNRNHPTTGKHYASKRMSKLEMSLVNTENGCIISPAASLIPLSRGISLYARFHACVCTGSWCNVSWRLDIDSDVWMAYVIVGLLSVLR